MKRFGCVLDCGRPSRNVLSASAVSIIWTSIFACFGWREIEYLVVYLGK
jgi:hypothetical protein